MVPTRSVRVVTKVANFRNKVRCALVSRLECTAVQSSLKLEHVAKQTRHKQHSERADNRTT